MLTLIAFITVIDIQGIQDYLIIYGSSIAVDVLIALSAYGLIIY